MICVTIRVKLGTLATDMPKAGFEPAHPKGYYVLNVARLPFRHFGIYWTVINFAIWIQAYSR